MLRPSAGETLRAWLLSALVVHGAVAGNPDAKRLYDDLLSNYNKLVRPVVNTSDVLRVCIKLKLSQLIDVLSSKSGISNDFSQQHDSGKKNEQEIVSLLNAEIKPMPDKPELKDGVLFHFVPYGKTFEGGCPALSGTFASKSLEGNFVKPSVGWKGKRIPQFISHFSKVDMAKRKNSSSHSILKSKRKSRKVHRSEGLSKKYKYLDSMNVCKRILENCRIIGEEDLDKLVDPNSVPAYLVVKLTDESESDFLRMRKCHSNQSSRLVSLKDEAESLEEHERKNNSHTAPVKMKDKVNQTNDVKDKCTLVNSSEIMNSTAEQEKKLQDSKTCPGCIRMNDYFRFQREFNASLLAQMENMLGQLTMMIKLLHEALKHKNSCKGSNREGTYQNLSKMKASGDAFAKKLDIKPSCAFGWECLKHRESKSFHVGNFEENYDNRIFSREDARSFDQDERSHSAGEKPRSIFHSYQINPEINKPFEKKIASHVPESKPKCHHQKKNTGEEKKNVTQLTKKNEVNELNKDFPEKREKANKSSPGGGDEKITKKNFSEEDTDYGDRGDDKRSDCNKKDTKIESGAEVTKGTILSKNQTRLNMDEGKRESTRKEIPTRSDEDKTTKLSSGSSTMNLKNQIMTTNLWVEQSWYDYKLRWDPKEYGGVHMLHVPSDHIWRPDIVLYNNADGNYEVTLMTKARVSHTGLVEWQPPAVYKSSCAIDVEFFPYDIQTCVLKLGSWTYDGFKVDLRHMDEKAGSNVVEVGVDLSEFYMSVEWDILEVPAVRNEKFYTCCDEPYLDITFNITMRRKTLFYTVNIIIPCMGISFLTVLTFYLPSDSGEKVTLSISILISLHVFFLLVVEIIPPTSLVVPLLGKYLIFAMILVSISICVTVVVLNVHFRSPQTHRMAPWVKRVFIHILPRLLVMRRPQYHFEPHRFMSRRVIMQTVKGKEIQTSYYPYPYQPSAPAENSKVRDMDSIIARQRTLSKEDFSPESLADGDPVFGGSCQIHGPPPQSESEELSLSGVEGTVNNGEDLKSPTIKNPAFSHSMCPPEVHKSCFCVRFIAEHTKMLEDSTKVKEDWKYVAMVLDRLFLWIFTLAVLVGTAGIILQAPTLYDDRIPIDKQFAEIQTSTVIRCPPQ